MYRTFSSDDVVPADTLARRIAFRISGLLARVALIPFAKLFVEPAEMEPVPERGVIIAANHRSLIDLLVGLVAFRKWKVCPYVLVRGDFLRHKVLGPPLRALRAIPAGRGFGAEAMAGARAVLRSGRVLALTPEGRVPTPTEHGGTVVPLRPGISRLATEIGSAVLLVGIANTDAVWPGGTRLPRLRLLPWRRPTVSLTVEWLRPQEDDDEPAMLNRIAAGLTRLARSPASAGPA